MVTILNTPQINKIISYLSAFITVFLCVFVGSLLIYQFKILNKGKKDKHIFKRAFTNASILSFMLFGFVNELYNRLSVQVSVTIFFLIGGAGDKIIKGLFENGVLLKVISKFAVKAKKDLLDSVTEAITEETEKKNSKPDNNNHDK